MRGAGNAGIEGGCRKSDLSNLRGRDSNWPLQAWGQANTFSQDALSPLLPQLTWQSCSHYTSAEWSGSTSWPWHTRMKSSLHTLRPWQTIQSLSSGGQPSLCPKIASPTLHDQSHPDAAAGHPDHLPSTLLPRPCRSPTHLSEESKNEIYVQITGRVGKAWSQSMQRPQTIWEHAKEDVKRIDKLFLQADMAVSIFDLLLGHVLKLQKEAKISENSVGAHMKHLGLRFSKWRAVSKNCQLFHHVYLLLNVQGSLCRILGLCSLTSGRLRLW